MFDYGSLMDVPRCPRCGCRADATAVVEVRLTPEGRDAFRRHADVVRRETGLQTEDEAVASALRSEAIRLNQG